MSNPWLSYKATPEDILRFLFSDPRFRVSTAEATPGERSILVDVGSGTHTVAYFKFQEEEWTFCAEGGGPAPWRDLKVTDCPINPSITLKDHKCPICGGVNEHYKIGSTHPILRFLKVVEEET